MIEDKFKEPDKFQWGSFKDADGGNIRYGRLKPEGETKGTMIMLPGFRESVEKYFEVAREMQAKGFDVWVMDWKGQGGSDRLIAANPQKAHNDGYDKHIAALHQFTQTVVEKEEGKPLVMMAHSMGAHIGLRYLKEHDGVFDSALMTSPMIDIITAGLPKPLARQMAKFAKAGNYLEKYIPGGTDWNDLEKFEENKKTSSAERFEISKEICRANDKMKIGDPTYGWIYHTFASIDILNDEKYLKAITTPILMEVSDNELIVDRTAQDRALGFLPNAKKAEIAGAKHEIWMERDDLRDQWLKKVEAFLDERLALATPKLDSEAPKKPSPPAIRPPRAPGM